VKVKENYFNLYLVANWAALLLAMFVDTMACIS